MKSFLTPKYSGVFKLIIIFVATNSIDAQCSECKTTQVPCVLDPNCLVKFHHQYPDNKISIELTTKIPNESSWIGLAFNKNAKMIGSDVVMALFDENFQEFFTGHLTANAPPIRDNVLLVKSISKHDGYLTYSFDQSLVIKNQDWSTNLSESCQFIAVVTGFYTFAQIFPHTYMPMFVPVCYNLTWTNSSMHESSKVNDSPSSSSTSNSSSVEHFNLKLIIDTTFSQTLRDKNSSEYNLLFSNLENFVKHSLGDLFKKFEIIDLNPGSILVKSILSVNGNEVKSKVNKSQEIESSLRESLKKENISILPIRLNSIQVSVLDQLDNSTTRNQTNKANKETNDKSKLKAVYVVLPILIFLIGTSAVASILYYRYRKHKNRSFLIDHSAVSDDTIKNDEITLTNITGSVASMISELKRTTTTATTMSDDDSEATKQRQRPPQQSEESDINGHGDDLSLDDIDIATTKPIGTKAKVNQKVLGNVEMRPATWSPDLEEEIKKKGEKIEFDLNDEESRKKSAVNNEDTLSLQTAKEFYKSLDSLPDASKAVNVSQKHKLN